MTIQEIADLISEKAGWSAKRPDDNNTIKFELEGNINVHIHSPNGESVFLYSKIATLSSDNYTQKQELEKYAKLAVATCKNKKSIISCKDNSLVLHQDISQKDRDSILSYTKDFLNDVAWWKKQVVNL